jgi:hypothetical protein
VDANVAECWVWWRGVLHSRCLMQLVDHVLIALSEKRSNKAWKLLPNLQDHLSQLVTVLRSTPHNITQNIT